MSSRFVRPETCTLKISHDDTLTVKRRLTAGEYRAQLARLYLAGVDGALRVNPLQSGIALVTSYLIDWSLTDRAGERVPIRDLSVDDLTSVLDALDPESFTEIKEAIEAHEMAQEAAREQAKNVQATEKNVPAISSSPSEPAGVLTGSVR